MQADFNVEEFFLTPENLEYVRRVVLKITRDETLTDDIVQNVAAQVLQKHHTFRGDCDVKSWLFRIARNEALGHFRKAKTRRRYMSAYTAEPRRSGEPTHEARFIARQQLERTLDALEELPEHYREVARMMLIEERPTDEVAEEFGISVSGVKSRLHRARHMLRVDAG